LHKRFFGGDGEEATPVPIPNTEVKLFSADGTAREAVWESRTPPKNFFIPARSQTLKGAGCVVDAKEGGKADSIQVFCCIENKISC
jgi:hypothetical protein